MLGALLALSLSLGPLAVQAQALPPAAERALARGEAWFEVRNDPDSPGLSGEIRAAEDIAAPPARVFAVMTDCRLATVLAPELRSCRILARAPDGRWDIREHVTRSLFLLPPVTNIFRTDYDPPHGFRFRRTGGDFRVLEGSWRLIPLDGGRRTRIIHESRAALPFGAPRGLARFILRQQMASALAALRRECAASPSQRLAMGAPLDD